MGGGGSRPDCNELGRVGALIMYARHNGEKMEDVMKLASGDRMAEQFVIMAYEMPKAADQNEADRHITDFQNFIHGTCAERFGSN
jgi:hypothetical protein